MKYIPEISQERLLENNKVFQERCDVYKNNGLDFLKSRSFILDKARDFQEKILDIGSGRGITVLALAEAGYHVTTVDTNQEMLEVTSLNLAFKDLLSKVDLYNMSAYALEFDDKSFNTVFMIEALHHMNDMEGLFLEILRVASPGAKLVLADFNKKGRSIIENVHAKEGRVHVSSSLGKDEAETWLSGHGFKLKTYENTCHWLIIADKL